MRSLTTYTFSFFCLILPFLLAVSTVPTVVAQSIEKRGAPEQIDDGWRTASLAEVGMAPTRLEELTRSLRRGEQGNVHAVLIEKDGRLVYEEYFSGEDEAWGADLGEVTFGRSSLHDLRSATKSVISTLVGIAIGRGEIPSVDTPIYELLPEYEHLLTGEKRKILLRHVLNMSAGLHWDEWSVPYTNPANDEIRLTRSDDPVAFVLSREQVSEPDAEFTYSGGLTQLLAAILEQATGREIEAYAREVLFVPLGIYDAVWRGNLNGMPNVASGLRLQARDLAKIGSLFINGGRWNGAQVVPEQWVDKSTSQTWTVAYPGESKPEFIPDIGYGYQWWIGSYRTTTGMLRVPMMWGNGEQRVMVVSDLGIVLTVFGGEYGEVTGMPDRLLVEYIIDALSDASHAQPSGDDFEAAVRTEVEEQHRREQKAFIEGDCDTVASFYSDEATRYLAGRRVSLLEALEFCKSLPRPFGQRYGSPEISDAFQVLSDNAVYFIRTIDFQPSDDDPHSFKREVVTKVWKKSNDEWKIVHFHSSVHSISEK